MSRSVRPIPRKPSQLNFYAPSPHLFLSSDADIQHICRWQRQWQGSAAHLHRRCQLSFPARSCSRTRCSLWNTDRQKWVGYAGKKLIISCHRLVLHLRCLFFQFTLLWTSNNIDNIWVSKLCAFCLHAPGRATAASKENKRSKNCEIFLLISALSNTSVR